MTDTARLTAALAATYRIERELGAGGMATVYLARDLKHGREVAIKVLREDLAASLGPSRFLREIQIAAQLQHPNILPLLDSGDADGFLYYVMPYVKGQSLRERLMRETELPIHEAVRLITEVVDALAHAHELGVVHRDIKPDNVMLSGRHALVADFGVAKAISEATGRNTVTTLGVAVGTPAYMSPEQAAADPHIDHRSDIYAVGAMAYELLTGRPPFTGVTPQQVLAAHVTEAPDPPTKRRPGIPPALEAIIMKCLAKRPSDRWQTAAELHAQLEPLATPSTGITPTQTRPIEAVTGGQPARGVARWMPWAITGGVAAAAIVFAVTRSSSGRGGAIVSPIRTQVTTSGEIAEPSISPDGKSVAYSTTSCDAVGRCTNNLIVQDIGGAGSLAVVTGAEAIYGVTWSPDGRYLVMLGSLQPQWGLYLVPATVHGTPQFLGCCAADFIVTSDTMIISPIVAPTDTVSYLRILTTADRRVRDSIRVASPELGGNVSVSDDGKLIAMGVIRRSGPAVIRLYRRDGRVTDSMDAGSVNTYQWTPGGTGLVFARMVPGLVDVADLLYQRVTPDGHFSGPVDTLATRLNMQRGDFRITRDGEVLAYAQGTRLNSVVALKRSDQNSTRGTSRRLATSTGALRAVISPDGQIVQIRRALPGADGRARWQISYMPADSGAETVVSPLLDTLVDYSWSRGNGPGILYSIPGAKGVDRVEEFDVATGRTSTLFTLPDVTASLIFNALPNGKFITFQPSDRAMAILSASGVGEHTIPIPPGLYQINGFSTSPTGEEVALIGFNSTNQDSIVVYRVRTADGTATQVAAVLKEGAAGLQWLGNGDLLAVFTETLQTAVLFRIPVSGPIQRLGVLPFGEGARYYMARDGKTMVASTSEMHGDVWLIKNFGAMLRRR